MIFFVPETPRRGGSRRDTPDAVALLQTVENEDSWNNAEIFHETGLHKPDVDETLYDHIYVTRRITACYSRYNDIFENNAFYKKSQTYQGFRDFSRNRAT